MDEANRELTLFDYWRIILRRKSLVIAAVVTCVGGALVLTALQAPVYEAEARMALRTLPGDSVFASDNPIPAATAERALETEIQVLESDVVQLRVIESLGLTTKPPAASGTAVGTADVVAVRVRSGSAVTAQTLANAYVLAYIELRRDETVTGLGAASAELDTRIALLQAQIRALDDQVDAAPADQQQQVATDLEAQRRALVDQLASFKQRLDQIQVDAALSTGGAQLVQPAQRPAIPIEPTPLRTLAIALLVGLLLGVGAALLLDYIDDSVNNSADVEAASGGAPVLSVVSTATPPDGRPLALSRPADPSVEAYRTLRTNLQFLSIDRAIRTIQVTSAMPGEGKTTTATNLAVVLAQADNRVLLIDADLRRPKLHRVFAIDGGGGLTGALLGEPLDGLMSDVDVDGGSLQVLPAGRPPANPSELLGGGRMKALLESVAATFDFVVIDSAPILPVTDSLALSGAVEAVVLVAQAGRTTTKQIAASVSSLARGSTPVAGFVINRVARNRVRSGDYGYAYGDGSGYSSVAD